MHIQSKMLLNYLPTHHKKIILSCINSSMLHLFIHKIIIEFLPIILTCTNGQQFDKKNSPPQ